MSTFKIAKYTGAQLAKMSGVRLAQTMASHVRSMVLTSAKKPARENYENDDQYERALVRVKEAGESLKTYLEEQRALFASKRLDADRAYKEAIVPTGETLPNGVEICRIVPLGFSIEPEEADPDTNRIRVRLNEHPAMNVAKDESRGRFNDGGLLIEQATCSVDLSERM